MVFLCISIGIFLIIWTPKNIKKPLTEVGGWAANQLIQQSHMVSEKKTYFARTLELAVSVYLISNPFLRDELRANQWALSVGDVLNGSFAKHSELYELLGRTKVAQTLHNLETRPVTESRRGKEGWQMLLCWFTQKAQIQYLKGRCPMIYSCPGRVHKKDGRKAACPNNILSGILWYIYKCIVFRVHM